MKRAATFLAVLVAVLFAAAAGAQSYPAKAIRLVVPIVPGGSVDLIARRFAVKMGESMGQSVVVENIAGASGTIGTYQVSRAAPDGYTIAWCTVGETIVYKFMSRNQTYDSLKDLTPLMAAVSGVTILAVHPSVPANTLKELVDYVRANPGKLAYGSAGIGSYFHMTGEMFKAAAGVDILHVPYKGVPPALTALAGGQVQMMFTSAFSAKAVEGKLRVLGVNEPQRYPGLPNIPAIAEVVPSFEKLPTWYAFFGPAAMPRPIVTRLNTEMNKALVAADMKAYLDDNAFISIGGSPEELGTSLRKGVDIYGQAVKLAGLKPE
jgi:tripartite-type tricarboxylate transporter receptor subunit TctC